MISACLVIGNEEHLIKRCLSSLHNVVAEIIIVLDGEPTDKTRSICEQFTKKIYVQQKLGEAEPHKTYAYSKAQNDWILEIDADEYLSEELQQWVKKFKPAHEVNGYRFIWRQHFGDIPYRSKYFMNMYGKTALFRKSKIIDSARELRTQLRIQGKTKNINFIIEHKPRTNHYAPLRAIKRSHYRGGIIASHLIKHNVVKLPALLYLPKAFLSFTIEFFRILFSGVLAEGYRGACFAFARACTFFFINTAIFTQKLRGAN